MDENLWKVLSNTSIEIKAQGRDRFYTKISFNFDLWHQGNFDTIHHCPTGTLSVNYGPDMA